MALKYLHRGIHYTLYNNYEEKLKYHQDHTWIIQLLMNWLYYTIATEFRNSPRDRMYLPPTPFANPSWLIGR